MKYQIIFFNILEDDLYIMEFDNLTADRWNAFMSELRFTRKNIHKFTDVSSLAVSFRLYRDDLLIVTGGVNSENHLYVEDWRDD